MYNVIFGPLASYVTDKIYWKKRNEGNEEDKGAGEDESNNNKDGEEQRHFTVSSLSLLFKARCHTRFIRAFNACICVFKEITWLAQTKVTTLKTQTDAVNAR